MQPRKEHGLTRAQRWTRCARKRRWADALSATAGALAVMETPHPPEELYVYQCPHCRGWHLTHLPQAGQDPVTLSAYTLTKAGELRSVQERKKHAKA